MSDDRFDTLAGGEQEGDELLARGRQIGRDTLAGGEQSGSDLLTPVPPTPAEARGAGDRVDRMPLENEDEDLPEHRSVA
jgi:hypothetical protein